MLRGRSEQDAAPALRGRGGAAGGQGLPAKPAGEERKKRGENEKRGRVRVRRDRCRAGNAPAPPPVSPKGPQMSLFPPLHACRGNDVPSVPCNSPNPLKSSVYPKNFNSRTRCWESHREKWPKTGGAEPKMRIWGRSAASFSRDELQRVGSFSWENLWSLPGGATRLKPGGFPKNKTPKITFPCPERWELKQFQRNKGESQNHLFPAQKGGN